MSNASQERLRLWLERTTGRLSASRCRDGGTRAPRRPAHPRDQGRGRVVPLGGLQDDAFAPGRRLALVPEPDNEHDPNAIGIWDAEQHVQAGYVPGRGRARARRAATGRPSRCWSSSGSGTARRPARAARAARRLDRIAARVIHELPFERRTLHGHFSRDLDAIVTIDPGDSVAFSCLERGLATSRRTSSSSRATSSSTPDMRSSARSTCVARRQARRSSCASTRSVPARSATPGDTTTKVDGHSTPTAACVDDRGARVRLCAVPRRDRHAARRAGHPLDRPAAALRRQHRLQGARRRDDALPADQRRRRALLGRRRARRAGRRRGVGHRDRVLGRARAS